MKVKAYQHDPDPRKQLIAKLVLKPRDLLVTVFMLNTLSNILLQNVSSSMFGIDAGWNLKIGFPLFLTLIFGEIVPKYIGLQYNNALAYLVAPSIDFIQRRLEPVRRAVIAITVPISRIMFFFLKQEQSISKEELQHVLKTSEAHGILQPNEAELVWGYLNLQDTVVKELMRPREDMLCYSIHEPLSKLTHLFVEKERSRIPVVAKDIDQILGIISAKNYFLHQSEISSSNDLIKWLAKPLYTPENTPAQHLLKRLETLNQKIALVIDEYGAISGLISQEDILEVVIGKISEQRDQKILYTKTTENEMIASGKLELAVFNEIFDVELESNHNMVTIGGWLIEQLGEIPKPGVKFQTKNFLFHVLSADIKRIKRLYARKLVDEHLKTNPRKK
jgi:CBS domain containing-hemolysin-like protein